MFWISTCTGGVIVSPAVTVFGCTRNATLAGGAGVTVTCALPLRPSDVASIVTGPPGNRPVTSPVLDTEARNPSDVLQVTARPVSTLPWSSRSTALNCTVAPAAMLDVGGDTVTVATAASTTVTCAAPDTPSMVAVIVTGPPTVTPVTAPPCDTVATAGIAAVPCRGPARQFVIVRVERLGHQRAGAPDCHVRRRRLDAYRGHRPRRDGESRTALLPLRRGRDRHRAADLHADCHPGRAHRDRGRVPALPGE